MLRLLRQSFDGLIGLMAGFGDWFPGGEVQSGPGLHPDG